MPSGWKGRTCDRIGHAHPLARGEHRKRFETYYYEHPQAGCFEYDEVMTTSGVTVYANAAVFWRGRELKLQVIRLRDAHHDDVVEAYVNPTCPREWESGPAGLEVQGIRICVADLTPEAVAGPAMEELKAFLRDSCAMPMTQGKQVDSISRSQLDRREAERFFILQQIDTLCASISRP